MIFRDEVFVHHRHLKRLIVFCSFFLNLTKTGEWNSPLQQWCTRVFVVKFILIPKLQGILVTWWQEAFMELGFIKIDHTVQWEGGLGASKAGKNYTIMH